MIIDFIHLTPWKFFCDLRFFKNNNHQTDIYIYIYIYIKLKLATVVEGDSKVSLS